MTEGMEQWDLTSKISPYLDRHMMFPLLEFLDGLIKEGTINYNSKDVAVARLALLKPTHMVDYAIDIHTSLEGGAVPKEMEDKKAATLKTLEELEKGCKALHEFVANADEKVRLLKTNPFVFVQVKISNANMFSFTNPRSLGQVGGSWKVECCCARRL